MKTNPKFRKRSTPFVQLFRTTPPKTICPNFYVLAHADGCSFRPQCVYCYLKSSFFALRQPEVFVNVKQLLKEVSRWLEKDKLECYTLNTGNLCDSMCFEENRPLIGKLVELFRERAKNKPHTLLLVTKGGVGECRTLFEIEPCANVVISFSINNYNAAKKYETGAPSVASRLRAASILKQKGWRVRIRIDPMIKGYSYVNIAKRVAKLKPELVTLGSLRAEPHLLAIMKNGLFSELEKPGVPHGLARYPLHVRKKLYCQIISILDGICPVGLCEEEPAVWDMLGLTKSTPVCNCISLQPASV
jgi:DNA repair photolyase